MARYINIDDVKLKGVAVFDENLDLLIPLSDVRKALQMTPTADVVPKSKVEEIFQQIDTLIVEYLDGLYTTREFIDIFNELKKKYTEDQI